MAGLRSVKAEQQWLTPYKRNGSCRARFRLPYGCTFKGQDVSGYETDRALNTQQQIAYKAGRPVTFGLAASTPVRFRSDDGQVLEMSGSQLQQMLRSVPPGAGVPPKRSRQKAAQSAPERAQKAQGHGPQPPATSDAPVRRPQEGAPRLLVVFGGRGHTIAEANALASLYNACWPADWPANVELCGALETPERAVPFRYRYGREERRLADVLAALVPEHGEAIRAASAPTQQEAAMIRHELCKWASTFPEKEAESARRKVDAIEAGSPFDPGSAPRRRHYSNVTVDMGPGREQWGYHAADKLLSVADRLWTHTGEPMEASVSWTCDGAKRHTVVDVPMGNMRGDLAEQIATQTGDWALAESCRASRGLTVEESRWVGRQLEGLVSRIEDGAARALHMPGRLAAWCAVGSQAEVPQGSVSERIGRDGRVPARLSDWAELIAVEAESTYSDFWLNVAGERVEVPNVAAMLTWCDGTFYAEQPDSPPPVHVELHYTKDSQDKVCSFDYVPGVAEGDFARAAADAAGDNNLARAIRAIDGMDDAMAFGEAGAATYSLIGDQVRHGKVLGPVAANHMRLHERLEEDSRRGLSMDMHHVRAPGAERVQSEREAMSLADFMERVGLTLPSQMGRPEPSGFGLSAWQRQRENERRLEERARANPEYAPRGDGPRGARPRPSTTTIRGAFEMQIRVTHAQETKHVPPKVQVVEVPEGYLTTVALGRNSQGCQLSVLAKPLTPDAGKPVKLALLQEPCSELEEYADLLCSKVELIEVAGEAWFAPDTGQFDVPEDGYFMDDVNPVEDPSVNL